MRVEEEDGLHPSVREEGVALAVDLVHLVVAGRGGRRRPRLRARRDGRGKVGDGRRRSGEVGFGGVVVADHGLEVLSGEQVRGEGVGR